VSRWVGLFGFALLVVSLVFPWFSVHVLGLTDKFTLADVRELHRIYSGICTVLGAQSCPPENTGLAGILPFIIIVMLVLNLIGSVLPELFIVSGFLGLLWAGIVYDDPARLLAGKLSGAAESMIGLELGFYIYFISSIILLIAGIIALAERYRSHTW